MIKQTLTALYIGSLIGSLIGSSLVGSMAVSAEQHGTNHEIKTIPSITALTANDKPITLEAIMADADWLGRQPESPYWGDDSKQVLYYRKQPGNQLRDLYVQDIDGQTPALVPLADWHQLPSSQAVYSKDGRYRASVFEGDIYLKSLADGQLTQVTHTIAAENTPQFLVDGQLVYRQGNDFYQFDLQQKTTQQLFAIKTADEPKGVTAPDTYLAKEQQQLIQFVASNHKDSQDRQDRKEQLTKANGGRVTPTYYFGAGMQVIDAQLAPNGAWLVLAVAEDKPDRHDSDIMPNYITASGNIDAVEVRPRVADYKQPKDQLILIDLRNQSQHQLNYDTLPGFDEDVLAAVKKENYRAENKKYQTVKAPRDIHIMYEGSMIWSADGSELAIMAGATDNKDRWLATVDFDKKTLVSRHRLHNDAWVNYEFNEFGWFNHTNTLYFQAEEADGYGHLYLLKPGKKKPQQLTKGRFEVLSPLLANDDQYLYFKGNIKHPGIYEIYRVNNQDGQITPLTDLGGMSDFTLSPDGQKLLIEHSKIAMPVELYVHDLSKPVQTSRRLTHTVSDAFLSYQWNVPAIVPVPSSEAKDPIFTKVYYPQNHQQGPARRAVIFVHGAGYTQNSHLGWSYYFHEFMFHSLLTQQGYVVIDMDYRASKGYGSEWRTAIYRNMGTPELQDLKDGVEWLVANANVDRQKIGVYGGSYGGFMTVMALFKAPDTFKAGAALRLVSDWAYYNDGYTSNILNTPTDDPIAYRRSSPIYFAEGLKAPLLINAPMVDDNVFFQDTVRLVQRMIELEKPSFDIAIFPVEPHGFRQPSSWLDEYRRIYKLFETHL